MTHLDDVVKKMTDRVQANCIERIEQAKHDITKPDNKKFGILSNMKNKRGLL
jgi:hypothetical protein